MMDMYFESSYDNMLSLDEMLDTDLKYSLELGLEVKDGAGIGAGPGLASEDWGTWGLHHDGGASSFDFDSSNGNVMVNPKSVIPSRRHSPVPETQTEIVKFKTEPDSDREEEEPARKIVKQEPQEMDDEEEEDEESDDGSEEDEEEQQVARVQQLKEMAQKKKVALTSVKLSQASGKPRTMWLLSKSQVDSKGPQIVNAGSLIKMKSFSDFVKAPSPTVTSNGVQIIKPNPNKLKTNGSKSPPSPIITSNGVQILKPNPNFTAKAKMQAQLLISSNHARTNGLKQAALTNQYPKPAYSYSCLIAMALKNSISGSLPVSEIYGFMCEHFPYFRSAPTGWKNSVRHNLSLNKCFEKIEKLTSGGPGGGGVRKGCLWAMNPTKISKMDDEVAKWSRKDPLAIRRAMRYPDDLERLEKGEMKFGSISNAVEEDSGDDEVPEEEESEENCEALKRINMFELAHILRDEESTRAFLYDYKLLPQSKICPRCNVEMKLTFASNFYGWFKCLNNHRANAIKGTWFEGTPLGCREILLATYCFLRRFTLEQTLAEVSSGKDAVDQEVIVSWWYNTREVCIDAIEREYDELTSLGPIGGVGCTVIVDKMKIGELNNSHRRIKDNVFILVMLETGTGDYRIEVLEKLDYNTMMNHIVANVEPGTELLTEDWKGFSRLSHFGFSHKVLADPERIPTDTLWFPFRQKLRMNGISPHLMGHYLYEYLWRREITRRDIDPFIALLQDVAKMHEL